MSTHNIIVLGPSGSGKTTYLASMYERLKIQRKETTFFLNAPLEQGNTLGRMYQGLMRGQLPDKTLMGNVTSWNFDSKVTTAKGTFTAFQLNYLDYAGERLTHQAQYDPHPEFHQAIQEADSVVGLIDGLKIRDYMRDPTKLEPIYENVGAVMRHIQANQNQMRSPVHFIITKWDVFSRDGKTMPGNDMLQQVRDVLMKFDDFRDFVQNHPNKNAPIRLIPVSALGLGYMAFQSDGSMRPQAGVLPSPYQVEFPLACALVDKMREEITTVAEREAIHDRVKTGRGIVFTVLQSVLQRLNTNQLRKALPDRFREVDEELLTFFRDLVVTEVTKRADQLGQWHEQSLQGVKDQKSAFNHVLENFVYLERILEERYPSATLTAHSQV
ncbi:MAG: hypothetical protein H0X24_05810 [Ktedonobacterales bacterium]|nr:hypothetical protein [Ktedonobacterales bacterium]